MAQPITTRTRFAPPEEVTKLSDSSDSKCNSDYDSGCIDSGFHSGANLSSEQFVSEEILSDENESKNKLDSGLCLTEQFSGLNLRSGDLTELSECEKDSRGGERITSEPSLPRPPTPVDVYFLPNEEGDTYLHCAVIQGFIEPAFALIRMVPNPGYLDIQNLDRQTALHLAVLLDQAGVARRLVQAGASLAPRDRHGNTALHLAAAAGSVDCLKALLEPRQHGVNGLLEQRNYDGLMCVHLAAWNGHAAALKYLVLNGANINAREAKSGRTVLHLAVELRRASVLQLLLEEGLQLIDLDATTYGGHTAHQLASCFDAALAHRLAQCGAHARPFPVDESSDSEDEDQEEMYRNYCCKGFQQATLSGDPINASA